MLPKSVLHKRNGHRQLPAAGVPSTGQILGLVHRDPERALELSPDLVRFAAIIQSERPADAWEADRDRGYVAALGAGDGADPHARGLPAGRALRSSPCPRGIAGPGGGRRAHHLAAHRPVGAQGHRALAREPQRSGAPRARTDDHLGARLAPARSETAVDRRRSRADARCAHDSLRRGGPDEGGGRAVGCDHRGDDSRRRRPERRARGPADRDG